VIVSKMSREKGKRGEREVFGLLSDLLGLVVKRNINARRGDCDSLELPGWACESKRVERWEEIYWEQAVDQAKRHQRRPVLFFRASRRPWVAMVDLADVCQYEVEAGRYRVEMSLEAFAAFVREELAAQDLATRVTVQIMPPPNGHHHPLAPLPRAAVVGEGG
jgi:hypothetical protein